MFIKEYRNNNVEYIIPDNGKYLLNLKKVNIFVGANNSGKSRFLRSIFQSEDNELVFSDGLGELNKKLEGIYNRLEARFKNLFYMGDLKKLFESRGGDYIVRFNEFYNKINQKRGRSSGVSNVWDEDVARGIENEMRNENIFDEKKIAYKLENRRIYVPMLRGLRHIDVEKENGKQLDLYSIRTEKDYKLQKSSNKDIFSGLGVYEEIKKMLLGTKAERQLVNDFENFLSEEFFDNREITLVSDYETDNLKINIGDNKNDREIFNVGDGIQSIIIATFQAFKFKDQNLILFLEEPELTMHPSTQRILIETLINKFPNLQIFLTTHSNHFLDLTYDYPEHVAIFSFEEKENEKFYINYLDDNAKILDLLGIRNSSVFLSNCVIWTEGVTDRMLLRKLLSLRSDFQYKEDYHYAFAEYGGGNLENFDFINNESSDNRVNVETLSKINFIIIDSDNISKPGNPKYDRRQNIKKFLGKNNLFDSHIEIENLIPFKVWARVAEKILSDKPRKDIKLKENYESMGSKFDVELDKKKIGDIFRKFLIEKKDESKDLDYFGSSSIQCLGLSKKEIMGYVIKTIDELEMRFDEFPDTTKRLVNSLNKFVETANK